MKIRYFNSVIMLFITLGSAIPNYVLADDLANRHTPDVIDMSDVKVKFRIKILGFTRISGQFKRFSGFMMNDENGEPYGVSMRIDVNSINTNDHQRDLYLRGRDFFEADRYPHITFKGVCTKQSTNGNMRLIGELKLRGHSKQVVFEIVETEEDDGVSSYRAKARIKRSEFGLNALKHIVSDDVEIIVAL